MNNPFIKMREFVLEVTTELKRSSWPTRKELVDSTVIVTVLMVIFGLFVAFADFVFLKVVQMLTGSA
jgi:preprotein translocase subunit SecE